MIKYIFLACVVASAATLDADNNSVDLESLMQNDNLTGAELNAFLNANATQGSAQWNGSWSVQGSSQ